MKKLKLLFPLLIVISLLVCSLSACGETDNGTPSEPSYNTISFAEAKADFAETANEFKSYCLEITVRTVKDATDGAISAFDESGNFYVSMLYMKNGSSRLSFAGFPTKVDEGDILVVNANLRADESGKVFAWRAEVLDITKADPQDESIADIRNHENGVEVTVDGVVAAITYSFGPTPSGVILVDESSSIYVYDSTIAAAVSVGNKITVSGTIGHWILADEQVNAAKFGYKGSCQIENASLVDKTDGKFDFDKSWIEQTTVKDLLEIPVSENITTKLYKVTALVKEIPGSGFTNFYFFDIDGTTGTYAYTQCNGDDFTWLREFDGKFCTVYITALNAKSTSSDCFFRFLPVAVYDEGYTFDLADAPKYAVDYHGLTQLKGSYTGDPELSLIGSASSELLGFENAIFSYSSSDSSIISFTKQDDGSYVMNCLAVGTATVTVSASFGGYSYSDTIEITVEEKAEIPSISVEEAINAADSTEVTLKGIVGPSFVHANRRGFYLIGEDKVIAISFKDKSDLKDIAIGNTVILKGTKVMIEGVQAAIDNAELLDNKYGSADFNESVLISGKSISEAVATGNTTNLFLISGTVGYFANQYSQTFNIDGVTLYSSSAATQYAILNGMADKSVTCIISVVNWNGKGYKPTLVALVTDDGYVFNNFSFDDAK